MLTLAVDMVTCDLLNPPPLSNKAEVLGNLSLTQSPDDCRKNAQVLGRRDVRTFGLSSKYC